MKIDSEDVRRLLDKLKDETLCVINEKDPLMSLVNINNKGVNHGVMQMYYKAMIGLYDIEKRMDESA